MKKLLLCISTILVLTACSTTNTLVTKKTNNKNSQKSYIIENVNNKVSQNIENSINYDLYFQEALNKALLKANFNKDEINYDTVVRYNISLDEGSRTLRYLVGFGAGQAKAIIKVYITNKINKEDLAEFNTEATLSMGFFGGDVEGILDNAANDIVEKLIASDIFLR